MLHTINQLLWGPGTLALLLGTGFYLLIRTNFFPLKHLKFALKTALGHEAHQGSAFGVSPFSSLMTALAASLGTGNIVGVATALVAGGPGALVWMEVSALLGMATVFAESFLSVKYRKKSKAGFWIGGPMYVMKARLGAIGRCMGILFSCFAAIAALGIGSMTQANAAAAALGNICAIPPLQIGILLCILTLGIILGGVKSIARVSAALVPVAAVLYLLAGIIVICAHANHLPAALLTMIREAFSFRAAVGGTVGTAALRWGIARGVFSNEAGLGSAAIAAASAESDHPVRQACISMTGPFFDTIVMCTVTGLAICCTGVLGTAMPSGLPADGADLTILAFSSVFGPAGKIFISVSIVLFAFSTIIGWEYLGERAFGFLSGDKYLLFYRSLFSLAALAGACTSLDTVYLFSDICNALMCLPNLLCLLILSGEVSSATKSFTTIKQRKKL